VVAAPTAAGLSILNGSPCFTSPPAVTHFKRALSRRRSP
jgi:hypothetical protein